MTKIHFRPYIPNQTVLFPQRIDEDIAENDPVRIVDALVESLSLESFRKLYKECGRSPYHPKMMLKVILYAYMNNIYSCRKIEKLLYRDIYYICLGGYEQPDFSTNNRFRNWVKKENQRGVYPNCTSALFQRLQQSECGIHYFDVNGKLLKEVADKEDYSENYLPSELPATVIQLLNEKYAGYRLLEAEVDPVAKLLEVDILT